MIWFYGTLFTSSHPPTSWRAHAVKHQQNRQHRSLTDLDLLDVTVVQKVEGDFASVRDFPAVVRLSGVAGAAPGGGQVAILGSRKRV